MPPATTVRLLPDVIDVSSLISCAGFTSLMSTLYGVCRGYEPERIARLAIFGSTVGTIVGVALLAVGLVSN